MARLIISDHNRHPIAELTQDASNMTWRKALTSYGSASFDLPLSSQYATNTYLTPANYIHIYGDGADTSRFINADFGGVLVNDYEISPHNAIVTVAAAGIGQLLDVTVTKTTQSYANLDVGSIIDNLITTSDNYAKLGLTRFTVDPNGPNVVTYVAGFGDQVFTSIQKLCKDFGGDFEVRPDFTYAYYTRQGQDNPNLVVRYGNQGNVQVDTKMHLVNTEMANQVYNIGQDGTVYAYTVNQTSAQFYGPKTVVIQDQDTYSFQDALTKAQFEALKRAFPQQMLDNITLVNTPLLPFNQLHLGDSVPFEAPALPFLASFQTLQRILAISYDDRQRTMNLTMGNALYVVLRGKLHEVRLYTSA